MSIIEQNALRRRRQRKRNRRQKGAAFAAGDISVANGQRGTIGKVGKKRVREEDEGFRGTILRRNVWESEDFVDLAAGPDDAQPHRAQ